MLDSRALAAAEQAYTVHTLDLFTADVVRPNGCRYILAERTLRALALQ